MLTLAEFRLKGMANTCVQNQYLSGFEFMLHSPGADLHPAFQHMLTLAEFRFDVITRAAGSGSGGAWLIMDFKILLSRY